MRRPKKRMREKNGGRGDGVRIICSIFRHHTCSGFLISHSFPDEHKMAVKWSHYVLVQVLKYRVKECSK